MGMPPGFWNILKRAAQTTSFKQLAMDDEFMRSQKRAMVVGIDGCLWITQCQAVFHSPCHAQMGRSPELRALFYKVAALNNAGVIAVFVFDGPNRPAVKRNKRVKAKPHWLVEEFMEMINLFGFYSYTAPGEAEAELAELNRRGHIDAVLSDDGDTMLFGARRVIRSLNKKSKDEITVYTAVATEIHSQISLSLGGILLLAILGGGDYDTVGLANCGISTAHALARCGLGDSLLEAVQTRVGSRLEEFLVGWREQLSTELATNSQGHLKSKQKALSRKIPNAFPSVKVLKLYVYPVTSWSEGLLPNFGSWVVKLPAVPELVLFLQRKFGWKADDMVKKLKKFVFPGMCVRRLSLPLNVNQHLYHHVVLHPALSSFRIIRARKELQLGRYAYEMEIHVGGMMKWAFSRVDAPAAAAGAKLVTWISAQSMRRYFPILVDEFDKRLCVVAGGPNYIEIPGSPIAKPTRYLGFIDLTQEDHGEGSSNVSSIVKSRRLARKGGPTSTHDFSEKDMVLADDTDMDIDIIDLT
ncbi:hypothetical protein MSAN_00351700 [Mycena sanguinolenta]|uniref:XPG-I domain-containing protein n=1 Tax=Mycena sanguinolenta TaxID=230812 RepID=A0A8H7DIN4_9AGAR|nr:hypothetical protein MSAN_00351700 [Mycena sanguinolenta]